MEKMIEWSKFEALEKKYTKLFQKHIKIKNFISRFEKLPFAVMNDETKEGLYLLRKQSGRSGIIYLKSTKIRKNHCDVCGKRRNTTAHHIIPRRLKSINTELSNIRIRVCSECESEIHPENGYGESLMLKLKAREVKCLTLKLNKKIKDLKKIILDIFDERLENLKDSRKNFVSELIKKEQYKKIHAAVKQHDGRLREHKYLRPLVNKAIIKYFNSSKDL